MPIHTDFIRAFLARWETRQAVAYIPCRKRNYTGSRAYAPALYGPIIGASGVTVGTGLDLGQQAEADLRRMGVSDALIARFRPYLGKRTAEAAAALAAAPLTLSDAECDALDAAVHAARDGKLKAKAREKYGVKGKASYEQAKAFASDVVRDAHFVYGKSNMPEFMRSNTAGRAMVSMYTFRTFTHNMVAMWSRMSCGG